jgi:hypothetical protein
VVEKGISLFKSSATAGAVEELASFEFDASRQPAKSKKTSAASAKYLLRFDENIGENVILA